MGVGSVLERAGRRLTRELASFVADEAGVRDARLEDECFLDANGARLATFADAAARGPLEVVERHGPSTGVR